MRTTRFSGADWADQLHSILVIGAGGISSWTILNLSRIGHDLIIVDPDMVDETNVTGGQMYRMADIGKSKVSAVYEICRAMGCINEMDLIEDYYEAGMGMENICITGLDNMKARKEAFDAWEAHVDTVDDSGNAKDCLFIDGRLTLEMFEVFAIQGSDMEAREKYRQNHLFSDEEAMALDCTTKQSTFGAMGIASFITATLCNFLTNRKLDVDFREVPFYQRIHFPILQHKTEVPESIAPDVVEVVLQTK